MWCFCRFYYFAFYVVQHYIDPQFKFAELASVLVYLIKRPERRRADAEQAALEVGTGSVGQLALCLCASASPW